MLRVSLSLLLCALAALTSATLHAATAFYSPSDGVVSFVELDGVSFLSLESLSGSLIPPVLPPPTGVEYLSAANPAIELQWSLDEASNQSFNAGLIVKPNTLLSDLTLNYTVGDSPSTRGFIVIVPEPTSATLLCLPAVLVFIARRRRK